MPNYTMSVLGESHSETTVHQLMILGEIQWHKNLIMDVFNPRDIEIILGIPLLVRNIKDSWYWNADLKGIYTVKSGYRSLQGTVTDDRTMLWKKLWKLNIPPKIKNFMWRTLTGVLPTVDSLRTRMVKIETTCPVCYQERESAHHLLLRCHIA